jgi:hypothetical protein
MHRRRDGGRKHAGSFFRIEKKKLFAQRPTAVRDWSIDHLRAILGDFTDGCLRAWATSQRPATSISVDDAVGMPIFVGIHVTVSAIRMACMSSIQTV